MTEKFKESSLLGGRTASEVVRIGDTVHRSVGPNSEFSQSVLKLLEEKKFNHSPRFLGIDEKGREVVSYIEGNVRHGEMAWTDLQLIGVVGIMKEFHEATKGSELARGAQVICHNDIAPWNIVAKEEVPVAFIDFDD